MVRNLKRIGEIVKDSIKKAKSEVDYIEKGRTEPIPEQTKAAIYHTRVENDLKEKGFKKGQGHKDFEDFEVKTTKNGKNFSINKITNPKDKDFVVIDRKSGDIYLGERLKSSDFTKKSSKTQIRTLKASAEKKLKRIS